MKEMEEMEMEMETEMETEMIVATRHFSKLMEEDESKAHEDEPRSDIF